MNFKLSNKIRETEELGVAYSQSRLILSLALADLEFAARQLELLECRKSKTRRPYKSPHFQVYGIGEIRGHSSCSCQEQFATNGSLLRRLPACSSTRLRI
jgi:hypothetical protein